MTHWVDWTFADWNNALFLHYFVARDDEAAEPVRRLLVTYEELARATHDETATADDVRETLRAVMHAEMLDHGRSILVSARRRRDDISWSEDDARTAPFVLHLVMTCLAASDTEGELLSEGNFRARLGELTEWSENQSMDALPGLWELLASWLEKRREQGAEVRRLVLPDPGWEKLIGYSKGLAFPPAADQQKLVALLARNDLLGEEPPIREALNLLLDNRNRFGKSFREALQQLRETYVGGGPIGDTAIWSAVRDAAIRDPASISLRRSASNWRVVAELDDASLLPLVLGREPWNRAGFSTQMESGLGEFCWVLTTQQGEGDRDEYDAAFRRILEGNPAAPSLPEMSRAARDGVLLFATVPGEAFWELVYRKPDTTSAWALVRNDLLEPFLSVLLGSYPRASAFASQIVGWSEVRGLDAANFAALDFSTAEALTDVRSLQSLARPARLHFIDGLRLGSRRFLGIRQTLPALAIDSASRVVAKTTTSKIVLERVDARTWQFPGDFEPEDGAEFEVEATTPIGAVRSKVRFENRVLRSEYKWPNDPRRWRCEGARQASVSLDSVTDAGFRVATRTASSDDWNERLAPGMGLGPIPGEIRENTVGCDWRLSYWPETKEWMLDWVGGHIVRPWDRQHTGTRAAKTAWHRWICSADVPSEWASRRDGYIKRGRTHPAPPANTSVPDARNQDAWEFDGHDEVSGRVANLERALAAMSTRRTGLSERDVLDLFRSLLGVWDWRLVWDIVRAWRETGALVRVVDKQWRSASFLAPPPRLVQFRVGRRIGATLLGLTTQSLRERFRVQASEVGCVHRERKTVSPYTPCPPGAFFASTTDVAAVAQGLGLAEPVWLRPLDEIVGRVNDAAEFFDDMPSNYPLHSCWDWEQGRFDASGELHELRGIILNHYRRPDSSDIWAVADATGGLYWWSYSRTWSLLVGHWMASEFSFQPAEGNELRRNVKAGVYLPIGIGNLLAVVSPLLPGPRNRTAKLEDGYDYIYPFPTQELRTLILEQLGDVAGLRSHASEALPTEIVRSDLVVEAPTSSPEIVLGPFVQTLSDYGVPTPSQHPEHPGVLQWAEQWVAIGAGISEDVMHDFVAAGIELLQVDPNDDPEAVAAWVLERVSE